MRTKILENSAGKFDLILNGCVIETCDTFASAVAVEEGLLSERAPDFMQIKGHDNDKQN